MTQVILYPSMLGILGGLLQGVVLGVVLVTVLSVTLKRTLSVNASTRFAVWFTSLIVLGVITVIPAIRRANSSGLAPTAVAQLPTSASSARAVRTTTPAPQPIVVQPYAPRPADRFTLTLPIDRDLPSVAAALYLLGAGCLFLRLFLSYCRLRRLRRNSRPAPPELSARFGEWLRISRCRRRVTLLVSADTAGPLAAGFLKPAVIIPEALLLQVTGREIDHIGLHEVAHLRRYDDFTTLVQQCLRTLFFFHPAVHWVCRQLEFDREVACDDSVVAATSTAASYARSLTKIAELAAWRRGPVLASGAVFRRGQISRRIELLLNAARDRRPGVSAVSFALVVFVVIGIASEFAHMPAFVWLVEGGSHYRSRWSADGRSLDMEMAGDIEFGDDDASIVQMSPHALLRIQERTGWSGRKIEIRGDASGRPEIRYFLHGTERALDEPGRAWLAGILPRLIRDSGIHAEERAMRILEKNGPVALFQEVDRISSDHSKRRYLVTAFQSGRLQAEDLRRGYRSASRMSSDHDKANFLIDTAADGLTPEVRTQFFGVAETIGSDHDRRRVASKAISEAGDDLEVMALAARSIGTMQSDHDKAEALKQMPLASVLRSTNAREAVVHAAGTIQSDHDKSGVLARMFELRAVEPEWLPDVMRVAEGIQSDPDKSRILEKVPVEVVSAGDARIAFFRAVRTIQSDTDRARVLTGFVSRSDRSADVLEEVCKAAEGIASDHEKANVLAASRAPLPAACFTAVRSISSDSDKRRVLERVLLSATSPETARAAVETAGTLSSDHDKAEVLICAAQHHADETTRALIRKVAEGVSSDSDYRRVTSQLADRAP